MPPVITSLSRSWGRPFRSVFALALFASLLIPAAAADAATISFTWSHLKNAAGATLEFQNPTTLQFGPDGRLYAGYQDGTIRAYTITRQGPDDYRATSVETITAIKNIANHDDDGTVNAGVTERLLLGLAVTGTASNPIIYASSSDPRFGSLTPETSDDVLDTNSGVVSRLTKSGSSWTRVDLVRGLPRSREIHAPNGIALKGTKLYLAVGGHTNAGGPSPGFGLLPEYALSAAILEIDLAAITSPPYDIPTLNDPGRAGTPDANDPFGGSEGMNQAVIVQGGPVKVYASGFRNPYDIVWHSNGSLYAMDNGSNANAGGTVVSEGPSGTCTNATVATAGNTTRDGLYRIQASGYYQGSPNPVRGNANNTFGGQSPVPAALIDPEECDYQSSGLEDGTQKDPLNDGLTFFNFSTNGIAEYTASNFDNAMKNDLVVAQLDQGGTGTVFRVALTAGGGFESRQNMSTFVSGYGNDPLDVSAQGDAGPFPGTIWVAMYGSDEIVIFEPGDFGGGTPPTCTGVDDPGLDEDGDGYDNADEIDAGSNPCAVGSIPPDNDGDLTSDVNDPDDDNDTRPDVTDPFQVDPDNGLSTSVPRTITWNATDPDPGGIIGSGFTGLMTNGTADYLDLFQPVNMTVGSAAGVFTIDQVPTGDAQGAFDNQQYGFQFGIDSPAQPFVVHTRISTPFAGVTPTGQQSFGLTIGNGGQDDYVKLVAAANGTNSDGFTFFKEVGGTVTNTTTVAHTLPGLDFVDLFLDVDPGAGTVQPSFQATSNCASGCQTGPMTNVGPAVAIPAGWLTGATGLAVGIISTSRGGTPFAATWDLIEVTSQGGGGGTAHWETRAPTGFARQELPYVEVGGKFYLTGGIGAAGGDPSRVQVYDPATNTWSDKSAHLPVPVHHVQGVAVGGKIYYVGGVTPTGTLVGDVQIYDPVADSFTQGAAMSRPRAGGGVAVHQGKIYYAGGFRPSDTGAVNWFDVYDPVANSWTSLPDMPKTRDHFHAQTVNGKFYALAGRNKAIGSTRSTNAVYTFSTGTWSEAIAPIPTRRGGVMSAVIGDEILVIGGEGPLNGSPHVYNTVEAFDTSSNTWRALPPMPTARHGSQAIVWNGDVYVAAGSKTQGGGPAASLTVHEVLVDAGGGGGGGGGDTSPPTAPTALSATAVSSSRVDLTWGPASDNIGVDEYQIERSTGSGFTPLATVAGSQTSFSDTTVAASTTYTYRVRACDAVPLCGPFSNQDQATTPGGGGGTLEFSDGFETGFSWDLVNPAVVRQATDVHAGSWAVRATSPGASGAAFAREGLPNVLTDGYYRAWFKLNSKGANEVVLLRVLDATKNWVVSFGVNANGKLIHKKHKNGTLTSGSTVVPGLGAWHELEAHVLISGASSLVEVWFDGVKVDALTKTFDLGTAGIGHLQIGDTTATRTFDAVFDDVAADESPIP